MNPIALCRAAPALFFIVALAGAASVQAQQQQTAAPTTHAAPEPDYTLSYNVGVVSDYRYRGVSQTRLNPTLQGGADFAHSSGFYVGVWGSGVKFVRDAGGVGFLEVDLYGGYRKTIGDFGYDLGVLHYGYPNNRLSPNANTTELYAAGSWRVATLKYSHSVTNLFGFADSKNSGYLDLSATFDLGSGLSLVPHVGHQRVAGNGDFSYTDYALTLSKDFYGVTFSGGVVAVSNNNYRAPDGRDLGRTALVVGVKKVF